MSNAPFSLSKYPFCISGHMVNSGMKYGDVFILCGKLTILKSVVFKARLHQPLFKNVFVSLSVFFFYIYFETFKCNSISDWLNHMAKPYGLANQKLCHIQIYKLLEKKTKNVLESGW